MEMLAAAFIWVWEEKGRLLKKKFLIRKICLNYFALRIIQWSRPTPPPVHF